MNDDSLSLQLLKIIIVDRQNDLEKIYSIERGSLALLALHQKSSFPDSRNIFYPQKNFHRIFCAVKIGLRCKPGHAAWQKGLIRFWNVAFNVIEQDFIFNIIFYAQKCSDLKQH